MIVDGLRPCAAAYAALAIAGDTLDLALGHDVPAGARRLIWDEFFASRGRGIDWATHLPWADDGTAWCARATAADGAVVAALLIRPVAGSATAMIGCVCVDPAFRGHGLSGRLIDLAAAALHRLGTTHLLLWTGKPGVYERIGFVVAAQERRLMLRVLAASPAVTVATTRWPDGDDAATGLPPFATAGWRAIAGVARIVFVDTPAGAALLDYSGAPEAVLDVMAAARAGDWSATLDASDPLLRLAAARGAVVDDAPGPLTMYRPLGADPAPPAHVPPASRI